MILSARLSGDSSKCRRCILKRTAPAWQLAERWEKSSAAAHSYFSSPFCRLTVACAPQAFSLAQIPPNKHGGNNQHDHLSPAR